jgi:L,D-transpeptidase ErfK/SrfK
VTLLLTQNVKPETQHCLKKPWARLSARCFFFLLLAILAGWVQDTYALDMYNEVFSNHEEYQLKKGERLESLAQRRALRLQVVTKQNSIKNPKPGTIVNLSYAFVLPHELTDGLVVNLAELTVYYFQNGVFLNRYPLAAGRRDWETPTGTYKILNKIKNPTWRVPVSIQWEMYDRGQEVIEEVPPGPKNPLGAFWMATSAEGVGFHATTSPWSVGRYASHGCFRMLPDQIEELFNQIEVGTKVKIIYKPIKLAVTADNRIYLEVHGDYYGRVPNFLQAVQTLARNQQLEDRIDWQQVKQVIKVRDGIAHDITKNTVSAAAEAPVGNSLYSGEIVNKSLNAADNQNQRPDQKKKPQSGS